MTNYANKTLGLLTIMLCLVFSVAEARMKSTNQGSGALPTTASIPSSQVPLNFALAAGNPATITASSVDLSSYFTVLGGSGAGTIQYTTTTPSVCTVSGSTLTAVAAGSCIVTATKGAGTAAGVTYGAASATFTLTIPPGGIQQNPLTVSMVAPYVNNMGVSIGSFNLTSFVRISGGSGGGAQTYTAGPSTVCTVSGNTLSALTPGTCNIGATKVGTANYAVATSTGAVAVTVRLTNQATLTASANQTSIVAVTGTATLSTTGGTSGGGGSAVTYAVTTGSCTVTGTILTAGSSIGSCTVTATKTAVGYNDATGTVTITVIGVTQATLTASASPSTVAITGTSTLSTSGGSGAGAVTYAVTTGSCTVAGTTLTAGSSAGSCTVTATKAANGAYAAAGVTFNITVTPTHWVRPNDTTYLASDVGAEYASAACVAYGAGWRLPTFAETVSAGTWIRTTFGHPAVIFNHDSVNGTRTTSTNSSSVTGSAYALNGWGTTTRIKLACYHP